MPLDFSKSRLLFCSTLIHHLGANTATFAATLCRLFFSQAACRHHRSNTAAFPRLFANLLPALRTFAVRRKTYRFTTRLGKVRQTKKSKLEYSLTLAHRNALYPVLSTLQVQSSDFDARSGNASDLADFKHS